MEIKELGRLEKSPIVEVVVGFHFDALALVSPVLAGAYWDRIRSEFPTTRVFPRVGTTPAEELISSSEPSKFRTWLVSEDDVYVVQIQADRFYLNWRRREGDYPRASKVIAKALEEIERFDEFLASSQKSALPGATSLEMAKVDHLIQGEHWSSFGELSQLLPVLSTWLAASASEELRFEGQFEDETAGLSRKVKLTSIRLPVSSGSPIQAVRLETNLVKGVQESLSLDSQLAAMSRELNELFVSFIGPAGLRALGPEIGD